MNMRRTIVRAAAAAALVYAATAQASVDSYRYLHVTIETPWIIFLGLAPFVMAPFILMGVMVWRFADRRKDDEAPESAPEGTQE
jgi:type VI protein secretion system component VasK